MTSFKSEGNTMLPEVDIYNEYMSSCGGDALGAALAIVNRMVDKPQTMFDRREEYQLALQALLREAALERLAKRK